MDEQNKGLNERWSEPGRTPERGYAADEEVDRRTSEIRSEITQTRGEMQETIDAIEDRLRPRNVVSRAAESVRDATVGRVRHAAAAAQGRLSGRTREWTHGDGGFAARIRENPVPAAIAAASLAWLAFSSRRPSDDGMSNAIYGSTADGDAHLWETTIATDATAFEDDLESSRSSLRERADRARERAQSLTSETASTVRDAGWRTRTAARRLANENTMAAGAIAAAIGVAIGLALPETRRENELMGEARDTVVDKARETARDAARRVQSAAEQVGKAAGEAVTGIDDTRI
jgi:hypothetical protein